MNARPDRQAAFVLHRRPYRETSLLLDLLTRDHGRVAVVARAARGSRRDWSGACHPFQPLLVSWSGSRELKTLTAAERSGRVLPIGGSRLYSALYANEILVRLLHPLDPHAAVFDAYVSLLEGIAGSGDLEPLLRTFELQLLRELGYAPDFRHEASSGELLEPGAHYRFSPGEGLSRVENTNAEYFYPGWILSAIERGDFGERETRRAAKRLLRDALADLLGGRPLNSREYFLSRGSRRPEAEAG